MNQFLAVVRQLTDDIILAIVCFPQTIFILFVRTQTKAAK